jgi:hypothetical protein
MVAGFSLGREDRSGWSAFLRHPVDRGLKGVERIIADACRGRVERVTEDPATRWQRGVVQFHRDVSALCRRRRSGRSATCSRRSIPRRPGQPALADPARDRATNPRRRRIPRRPVLPHLRRGKAPAHRRHPMVAPQVDNHDAAPRGATRSPPSRHCLREGAKEPGRHPSSSTVTAQPCPMRRRGWRVQGLPTMLNDLANHDRVTGTTTLPECGRPDL